MGLTAILALIEKGLEVYQLLKDGGQIERAQKAWDIVSGFVKGGQKVKPTKADIDKARAELDTLIDEFNEPLPPA